MGYRTFTDSQGTEWQAWDIIPRLAERRASDRRLRQLAVARERRAERDRRLSSGPRPTMLGHGLNAGWLCFEGPAEKRRLTPIPSDWLGCPQAQLERYLGSAVPASRVSPVDPQATLGALGRRAG
jgi:hypothetical protein